MAAEVFDGFDHTRYKDEVIERWGKDAYESGDRWWRSMSDADKKAHFQTHLDIAADYGRARAAGLAPNNDEVQAVVERHYAYIGVGWQGRPVVAEAFIGLGEMYVADPRFAANYDVHGEGTTEFVRDAMKVYAEARLR